MTDLHSRMLRNAELARAVGVAQCFFAALEVASLRKSADRVVPEVEVAEEYFVAARELAGEPSCQQ